MTPPQNSKSSSDQQKEEEATRRNFLIFKLLTDFSYFLISLTSFIGFYLFIYLFIFICFLFPLSSSIGAIRLL